MSAVDTIARRWPLLLVIFILLALVAMVMIVA